MTARLSLTTAAASTPVPITSAALVAVGRSTFDIELAQELADAAAAVIRAVVRCVTGSGLVSTDPEAVVDAVRRSGVSNQRP